MPEQDKYYNRGRGRDLRKRKPGVESRRFEVNVLQDTHREIARRKVLGEKNSVIAKAMNVSPVMVSYTVNSPNVKDKIDALNGSRDANFIDVKAEIRKLLPKAMENYNDILNGRELNGKSPSANLIARTSADILDREIGKPTQTLKSSNVHAIFTAQDIEEIKNRAVNAGATIDI